MQTTLPILNLAGKETGTFEVPAAWLEYEKGAQAVHDSVVAYLAGLRAGTACAKGRSDIRGTGAKPYRQKGTGRARAGSRKSPIWRGGGVVFGPTPRSFAKKVNRKVQRLALRRIFTDRLGEGDVVLLEGLNLDEPKTKCAVDVLNAVGAGEDVLVLVNDLDGNAALALRNLPAAQMMKATAVNVYWLSLFGKVVFTKDALEAFGQRIGSTEVAQ